LQIKLFWTAVILEPGDYVTVTHALIPNRSTGALGVTGRLYAVLNRTWNFTEGTVEVKLLDVAWLQGMAQSLIAPDATPAWTSQSPTQKATLASVASYASGKFSDGASGKTYY
jgi:hypothetical protein